MASYGIRSEQATAIRADRNWRTPDWLRDLDMSSEPRANLHQLPYEMTPRIPRNACMTAFSAHFLRNQIFIDVDYLELGADFVEAIEASVFLRCIHSGYRQALASLSKALNLWEHR